MDKLKICIFSDIHYTSEKNDWNIKRKLVEYAEPFTDKMIYKINNEIKPDICIHLGDMIQSSQKFKKDTEDIEYIWEKLKKIQVPFYSLLGNHELKSVDSNKQILDLIGYKNATFSINMNGYHLIFIGTDINRNDYEYKTQYISQDDLKWLENDLNLYKSEKNIIFSHFGIAEDNMEGSFWFSKDIEGGMLRNRFELKKLFQNKNIIAVFCGHQHWTKKIIENEISYYMLGSLIENIKSDGIPDGVYFVVNLENSNINVKEKHLQL